MFHAGFYSLSLEQLGRIEQDIEIIRVQESLIQVVHNLAICRVIALVLLHNVRENIAVFGQRETFYAF
jgi:hypothetical protein